MQHDAVADRVVRDQRSPPLEHRGFTRVRLPRHSQPEGVIAQRPYRRNVGAVFGDHERDALIGRQRSAECLTLFGVFDRHVQRALCGADVHQRDQCSAQIEFVHHHRESASDLAEYVAVGHEHAVEEDRAATQWFEAGITNGLGGDRGIVHVDEEHSDTLATRPGFGLSDHDRDIGMHCLGDRRLLARDPPATLDPGGPGGEIRRVRPGPRFGQRQADDGLAGDTAGDPALANFVAAVCGEQGIADIRRERQIGDRGVGVGKFLDRDADSQHVAALAARRLADQGVRAAPRRPVHRTRRSGTSRFGTGQASSRRSAIGPASGPIAGGEVVLAEGERHGCIHGLVSYRPW